MGGSGSAIKAVLLGTVLLLALTGPSDSFGPDSLVGMKAPEFAQRDLKGNYVSVTAMRGGVVVINFWASWCPVCKREMPELNRLYNGYRRKGLKVIAVSMESSERGISNFLQETPVDFSVIHDQKGRVSKLYGVYSIPTSVVVDRSGTVAEVFIGEKDWASPRMRDMIEDLIEGQSKGKRKPGSTPVLFFDKQRKNSF